MRQDKNRQGKTRRGKTHKADDMAWHGMARQRKGPNSSRVQIFLCQLILIWLDLIRLGWIHFTFSLDTHVAKDSYIRPDLVARALLGASVAAALPVVVKHFHLSVESSPIESNRNKSNPTQPKTKIVAQKTTKECRENTSRECYVGEMVHANLGRNKNYYPRSTTVLRTKEIMEQNNEMHRTRHIHIHIHIHTRGNKTASSRQRYSTAVLQQRDHSPDLATPTPN